MATVKLTKNELKKQKDNLKQFERYLPTLQLKKQQLQMVAMQVAEEIDEKESAQQKMMEDMENWVAVFSENTSFGDAYKIENLIRPDKVICKDRNIAGVIVPAFEELTFQEISYSVSDYPLWVDKALVRLREIARLRAIIQTLKKEMELINRELRLTSQRVNLFEKVKIPETKENIRVIEIYLGDMQTAAVVRGKIAKNKRQGASA